MLADYIDSNPYLKQLWLRDISTNEGGNIVVEVTGSQVIISDRVTGNVIVTKQIQERSEPLELYQ